SVPDPSRLLPIPLPPGPPSPGGPVFSSQARVYPGTYRLRVQLVAGSRPEVLVLEGAVYTDWETIYQENVVRVYRLIFSRVGNRPDAEDLTSEVFVKSLPQLSLPSPVAQVRAYISAAVRSVLADHWRRHYGSPLADVEVDNIIRPFELTHSPEESG